MGLLSGLMGNASVVSNEQLEKDYAKLLIKSEKIEAGFKVFRDMFISYPIPLDSTIIFVGVFSISLPLIYVIIIF